MYKYAQLKRFHIDHRLQFYMYYFMYVGTDTLPLEDYFDSTITYADKYKKISTPVLVPKHWLGFSNIHS